MAYANAFNILIFAMELAVLFFAIVAIAFVFVIVFIHRNNVTQTQKQNELHAIWERVFSNVASGSKIKRLGLRDEDRYAVLLIFHSMREFQHGDSAERLNVFAREIQLDAYARELLKYGDSSDRILAIGVLGQLGNASAFPAAESMLGSPGLELSQASAQCMLRLDPQSIDDVLAQVSFRDDWMAPRVEQMLRELGPTHLDPAMKRTMLLADDRGKQRLLEFAGCCSDETARTLCLEILIATKNPELTAATLRALAPHAQPADATLARRYLHNENWFVQLAALRVLEPLASEEDLPALETLAGDRDWWVRHRAAEVLVTLSHGNSRAKALAETHPDAYARAAIAQAIAEYTLSLKNAVHE